MQAINNGKLREGGNVDNSTALKIKSLNVF